MDVSDRRMQVQLTPEAKIAAEFLFYQSDFCVCGLCQRSEAPGALPDALGSMAAYLSMMFAAIWMFPASSVLRRTTTVPSPAR